MGKFNAVAAGLVLAGLGLAAIPGTGTAKVGALAATPAQRCVTETWHKRYGPADADVEAVRAHLVLELARAGERGPVRGIEPRRLPTAAHAFTITLESRHCEAVSGGPALQAAPISVLECNEVGCADPAPGTGSREGAIMVIESCEGGQRTTAVYERRDGRWVLVEYNQVRSTECGPAGRG